MKGGFFLPADIREATIILSDGEVPRRTFSGEPAIQYIPKASCQTDLRLPFSESTCIPSCSIASALSVFAFFFLFFFLPCFLAKIIFILFGISFSSPPSVSISHRLRNQYFISYAHLQCGVWTDKNKPYSTSPSTRREKEYP